MQNWMVGFIASVLDLKYSFWASLIRKMKMSVSAEIWYLVWLKYEEFNSDVHSFCFLNEGVFFMANLFQKSKLFVEAKIRSPH